MQRILTLFTMLILGGAFATAQNAANLPSNVPQRGLAAYYGFDGNADDYSGNANNGVLETGGATNVQLTPDRNGLANRAYKFGGISNRNYIRIPDSATLHLDKQLSISLWVQMCGFYGNVNIDPPTDDPGFEQQGYYNTRHTIIAKGGDGHQCQAGYTLYATRTTAGEVLFRFTNSNGDVNVLANINSMFSASMPCYDSCEWVHVVIVVDNRITRMYINGTLYQETTMSADVDFSVANTQDLYIGRRNDGTYNRYPFSGTIDDIAFYNVAITDEEVDSLYNRYQSPQTNDNLVVIDSIVTVNPCGNTMGSVTIYPQPGITYQYGINSPNDPQQRNVYSPSVGTYRFYAISQCALWDTVITLVCDCADDPSLVSYDTVCPGTSGQRGGIETLYTTSFNSLSGWSSSCNWESASSESNYLDAGFYYSSYRGYSSKSAFCPSYYGYFANHTCYLTLSQGIVINNDLSKVSISFAYLAVAMQVDYSSGYNTLKLEYATSAGGPWNTLWTSGGGDVDPWRTTTISLSSLPGQGTYYFRFVSTGRGYVSAVDDFTIKSDTRWSIPDEVGQAAERSTVRTSVTLDNSGTCPIEEVTFWYIAPTGHSYDTSGPYCDSAYWYDQWYFQDAHRQETGLKTTFNCDSTADHQLVIFNSDKINIIDTTVCDSYTWPVDNTTYTATIEKFVSGINSYGCPSNDSLHLVVNYSFDSVINDSIREENLPYITFMGDAFDEEQRNYLYHFTTIHDCDSNYHINLSIIRKLYECDAFLQFPNYITPNGDGHNDSFRILGISRDCYPENSLVIYSRWGARVYRADNITSSTPGWDAAHMPAGTYFYHFTGSGPTQHIERNGVIEVLK